MRAVNRVGRSGPSLPAEATPIAQVVLDLAHFANGAGIISEVVLVNVAPHPIRPALYFYDQEGEPIAAESMVDVLGDLEIHRRRSPDASSRRWSRWENSRSRPTAEETW